MGPAQRWRQRISSFRLWIRSWRTTHIPLLAALALVFTFASPLHLPLNNPNEGVRVFMVKAMVDENTFALDKTVKEWGYIDDKAKRDGHIYSSKAPLMSLLGAAAYALIKPITGVLDREALTRVCRVFATALPVLLLVAAWSARLRRRIYDPVIADIATVGVVMGTGVLAYTTLFTGHAVAAMACGVAFLLMPDETLANPDLNELQKKQRFWSLVGIGFLLPLAVGAEYPAFLAAAPLGLLCLWRCRRFFVQAMPPLLLGALLPSAGVLWAHHKMFGAPWRTGYSMLENQSYAQVHGHGFFGIGVPKLDVLLASIGSPYMGLLFFAPLLAVGLLAVCWPRRWQKWGMKNDEGITLLVCTVFLFAFISGHSAPQGGWSVGPRYIGELWTLLCLPAVFFFDRLALPISSSGTSSSSSESRRFAVYAWMMGLVVLGVIHSGAAGLFYPHLSDVYLNPVYQQLWPTILRGFSPDTWLLWIGATPETSTAATLFVLSLPVIIVVLRAGWRHEKSRDSMSALVVGIALSLLVALGGGPLLTKLVEKIRPNQTTAAPLETRRLYKNWWPVAGNPYAADSEQNPRMLAALGYADKAFEIATATSCIVSYETKQPPLWGDIDVFLEASKYIPTNALLVVGDGFADHLVDAARWPGPFIVTSKDIEKQKKLPCVGDVWILQNQGAALPAELRKHVENIVNPDQNGQDSVKPISLEHKKNGMALELIPLVRRVDAKTQN